MSVVEIRPYSKRNGITLTVVGASVLFLGIGLFLNSADNFAVGLTCFSLGAVALILGAAKLLEPSNSFTLDSEKFTYRHRRGKVSVHWRQIQRVDIVRVNHGLEMTELPYIGIKLKSVSAILDTISPRLATGLLTEQRPLMMTATAQGENEDTLEAHLGLEFTPLIVASNEAANRATKEYTGVLAMFGHRSMMLDQYLGYHLYVPLDSLDRPAEEFLDVLRGYMR